MQNQNQIVLIREIRESLTIAPQLGQKNVGGCATPGCVYTWVCLHVLCVSTLHVHVGNRSKLYNQMSHRSKGK